MRLEELTLDQEGAQLFRGALSAVEASELTAALAHCSRDEAGVRLFEVPGIRPFLSTGGPIGRIAASALGPECLPVRAILFDKSAGANWSLGWHQDRTIAVRRRIDVDDFGPWSVKRGVVHVEPPFKLLAGMVTLRAHLDAVSPSNAPLLIAPGSHRRGRIPAKTIAATVTECGVIACLADAGDIWLYSTPILHASDAAIEPRRRRVLQVDYAAARLPGGLEWLGV